MKLDFMLLLRGMLIGGADVVPGVSGGTMALIVGLYQRFVAAISHLDFHFVKLLLQRRFTEAFEYIDLALLLPLGIGMVSSILFFTKVISLPNLINNHSLVIYSIFFGIIVSSIIHLVTRNQASTPVLLVFFIFGLITGGIIVALKPSAVESSSITLVLAGFLAVCAMLLPGISGSYVLLIIGLYPTVLNAVAGLEFQVLVPFGLGGLVAIFILSRFISFLFASHFDATICFMSGLLTSSLWIIWPFRELAMDTHQSNPIWPSINETSTLLCFVLMLITFTTMMFLYHLAGNMSKMEKSH